MKIIKANKINNTGLTEMADYFLHERRSFKEFLNLSIDKNSEILILGGGQGAFEEKLLNEDYKNITSIDLNEDNYKLKDKVKFVNWDLNKDFEWDDKLYDVIVAIEIIEHLESSPHFLRECSKKIKKIAFLF